MKSLASSTKLLREQYWPLIKSRQSVRMAFGSPLARLIFATVGVIYIVLVSGVLVAGKGSISACLGWPVYSPELIRLDAHAAGNILRLVLSIAGIGLVGAVLWQAWRKRNENPAVYKSAGWVLAAFLLETLVQVLLLVFGFKVALLVPYTLIAAGFWGALVALGVRTITIEDNHPVPVNIKI